MYNFLLPSGIKVLKAKTIHEINGLIWNIQYFWSINICCNLFELVYFFLRFCLQDINTDFMFEIFHPQSNTGLKASLALMYMTALILQSSNLEWSEKESIIYDGAYFQHR